MTNIQLSTKEIRQNFRPCPLCMAKESYKLLDLNYALFDDSPLNSQMLLNSCSHCGFVFFDTKSNENDFDIFYKDHYFIHAYNSTQHDYQTKNECYSNLPELFTKHGIIKSCRIIDVGCGQGQLIRSLRLNGFTNIAGIELCRDYVDGLNKEGIEAYYGSALDIPIKKETADLLIYKHIFEHFYDLHTAIEKAIELLVPGGHIFVAVPDCQRYNNFKEYSPLHYFTVEHINHFDLHHVESLFAAHGMTMEHTETQMLDISEDYPVPIMSCLFRKQTPPVSAEAKPDFGLALNMAKWFERCRDLNTRELQRLQATQKEVYVWGISYRTAMYLAMSALKDCNIQGFFDIDVRKRNKHLLNKQILSPDTISSLNDDVAVVIGVGPSSISMVNQLSSQGFKGEIVRLI